MPSPTPGRSPTCSTTVGAAVPRQQRSPRPSRGPTAADAGVSVRRCSSPTATRRADILDSHSAGSPPVPGPFPGPITRISRSAKDSTPCGSTTSSFRTAPHRTSRPVPRCRQDGPRRATPAGTPSPTGRERARPGAGAARSRREPSEIARQPASRLPKPWVWRVHSPFPLGHHRRQPVRAGKGPSPPAATTTSISPPLTA